MVNAESCHPAIGIWLDANESAFVDQAEFLIGSALQFPNVSLRSLNVRICTICP